MFPLMFRKHPLKIALQSPLKNSKRIYFYFGINSPKRKIANRIVQFSTLAITVILGGSAPSTRISQQDNLLSSQP